MHQEAFDEIKAIISKETMLHYPNYKLPFLIFLHASDMQLGAHASKTQATNIDYVNFEEVLKQDHCPALLNSRKLNNYQINYTVIDKELLSIADALVEHRSILCGEKIFASSDHKNITHLNTTHVSTRAQRRRSLLEDFGCTVFHVPGEKMN